MKTDKAGPTGTDLDRELGGKFAEMRAREAEITPAFPDQTLLPPRQLAVVNTWSLPQTLPRVAAAIALVAVIASLLIEQAEDDPAVIYARIMNQQEMQTDQFLLVSASVLPEMMNLPSLYEIDFELDPDTYTN